MDYLKQLITDRVELLNKQIMFKDVTVQTEEENVEELKQLTEALNNYDLLHNVSISFTKLEQIMREWNAIPNDWRHFFDELKNEC